MTEYKVVEHITEKEGGKKEFTVMAIDYVGPSSVKISTGFLPKVGPANP